MRACLIAALLLFAMPAVAQPFSATQRAEIVDIMRDALAKDPTILRDAILALQAASAAPDTGSAIVALRGPLTRTPGDPIAGNPQGDVTLVEFSDPRCPYCRRMLPVIAELLGKDRKLRIVFKDIPILGPASVTGARAMWAAARQNAYLKMRDAMMNGPSDITVEVVKSAAASLGLDWVRLQRDMNDPSVQTRLDENVKLARQLSVQGTPAYVIGDRLLEGAVALTALEAAISAARTP